MQASIFSHLKRPLAVLLFSLSFLLLQLCMVQMSAQAFSNTHQDIAQLQMVDHDGAHQQKADAPQHHSSGNNVCAVSNCTAPLPQPLAVAAPALMMSINLILPQPILHGLPPVLSDRPPQSVFA